MTSKNVKKDENKVDNTVKAEVIDEKEAIKIKAESMKDFQDMLGDDINLLDDIDDEDTDFEEVDVVVEKATGSGSKKEDVNCKDNDEEELTEKEKEVVENVLNNIEKGDNMDSKNKNSKNNETDDMEIMEKTKEVLGKFKKYISSAVFNEKCDEYSNKYDLDSEVVKTSFIKRVLGKIAKILHITVRTAGNIIQSTVLFLNDIISNVTAFTVSALDKVIDLVTLNTGRI